MKWSKGNNSMNMKRERPAVVAAVREAPTYSPLLVIRALILSIALSQCAILILWGAVTTLCQNGDQNDRNDASTTCPHAFYAESNGQCVALVEGGGGRADDFSGGVICQDAEIGLALARKYSPFLPSPTPSVVHSTCCEFSEKSFGEEEEEKNVNPIARLFGKKKKKKRRNKKSTSNDDRKVLKKVVSRHRANPDNIDKQHPVRRIVESAATLFGRRKAKRAEIEGRKEAEVRPPVVPKGAGWAQDASSSIDLNLDGAKKKLIAKVTTKVREQLEEESAKDDDASNGQSLDERVAAVGWGGPIANGGRPWWLPPSSTKVEESGTRLAAAYLKIMGWPTTGEYTTKFPFKKCSDGCEPNFALTHTLEWREKFKPWCMTPSAVKENKDAFFYVRGHSPPPSGSSGDDAVGHSLVFYRPGLHKYEDTEAYLRIIMYSLDAAVAESLTRSDDKIGKFNIILDCNGFSMSMIPSLSEVKRLFTMMQDHMPDRLGVLMIANLSGPAQLFLRVVKAIISEAVRRKIHIIPTGDKGRDMLEALIDEAYIPTWLGGTDEYVLDAEVAYADRLCSEEEGREYLETMPYHAAA